MKPSSKARCYWRMARIDPFLGPYVAGLAVLAALYLLVGAMPWWWLSWISWGLLWAVLEQAAMKGHPKRWVRRLTPNFCAIRDLFGTWRIFEKRPLGWNDCRTVLGELIQDQRRLPAPLTPGRYRTLTHDTILLRLQGMANVKILSCHPAYVATLEHTISQIVRGRCRRCSVRCPFPGRTRLRTFYDIKFQVS